jgi:hypothetical protein
MTHAHPQSWSEISSLAISEDAVRQLHPAESHKLYLNRTRLLKRSASRRVMLLCCMSCKANAR